MHLTSHDKVHSNVKNYLFETSLVLFFLMIDAQHENSMSLRPLVNYITVCVLVVVDLSRILNLESSKYNNFFVLCSYIQYFRT